MAAGAFEVLCGCLVLLLLIYYYLTINFNYWKSLGVNGPNPIPFFGNISRFYLGKMSLGDYLKEIYDYYPQESAVGIYIGREPALVLRDPEYIKHVLIKDFSYFGDRVHDIFEKAEPLSMHLFKIDAARWKPLRTRLSPVFTSGKLKEMFHLLLECSENFEESLHKITSKDPIIETRELTAQFTTEVIASCAFGIDVKSLDNKDCKFREMGRRIFTTGRRFFIRERVRSSFPWLYNQFGYFLNDIEMGQFFTDISRETIDYRKKNNVQRHDFIDVLVNFKDNPEKLSPNNVTDEFVTAQLIVFFAAGFETSSSTISYTLYELAQNHSIQDKVREEIKEIIENDNGAILYDSIKKMTYLHKIFQETLRKHPPLMYIGRKAMKTYTFENSKVTVSKGQKIFIPIYALQRDANIYPNPEVYDPERFSEENIKLRNPMYHLPFGDGPRNCIGARFSVYQVKIGLIKILLNYKVDICEKTQIPYINNRLSPLTLQPEHGTLYVKFTKLT